MAEGTAGSSAATFSIGERFKTFIDLQNKLKEYEVLDTCSRTVNAARTRLTRHLLDEIKYYQVSFRCIHGGRKFVAKGEGKRSTL